MASEESRSTREQRTMNKKDIQSLRKILRHIPTADPILQKEILRLDAILETMLKPKKES